MKKNKILILRFKVLICYIDIYNNNILKNFNFFPYLYLIYEYMKKYFFFLTNID